MGERIIFKVNNLDNGHGFVGILSTFNKNLSNISPNYYDELRKELSETGKEQVVRFEVAGRYVVLVAIAKNLETVQMIFFDLKKDDEFCRSTLGIILHNETDESIKEELGVAFILAFKKCNQTYDKDYDLVELELDIAAMN